MWFQNWPATGMLLSFVSILPLTADTAPLKTLTEKSCRCIESLDVSKIKTGEQRNMQLGLCVIKSAKGYEKFLKTEKNIDMERIGEGDNGTRLGYLFAVEAAGICPDTLAKYTGDSEGNYESTVSGRITDISHGAYAKLTIEDAAGKTITLYWIFNFENSGLLLKAQSDKTVRYEFTYNEKEIYFSSQKEYHKVKIIAGVKKL